MKREITIALQAIFLTLFLSVECSATHLFSFVHVTDTHCTAADKNPQRPSLGTYLHIGGYKFHWTDLVNSFSILKNTVEYINSEVKPDFLIHTGDISDRGGISNLRRAKLLLNKLDCPYWTVMGDHDLGCSCSDFDRCRSDCNYTKTFGGRCLSFDHSKWHFVILGIYPNQEELDWLRNDLAKNSHPIIFATHRLIVADRLTLGLAKRYLNVELLMPRAKGVRAVLKNCGNVRLCLSGHCHSNFRWDRDKTTFISTAALVETPHQFALLKVYPDKIDITLFSANTAEDVSGRRWSRRHFRSIRWK